MNYYIFKNGEQRGPYTMDQMKHLWRTGQITSETPYWHDGMPSWMPLGVLIQDVIAKEKFEEERARMVAQAELHPVVEVQTHQNVNPLLALSIFGIFILGLSLWSWHQFQTVGVTSSSGSFLQSQELKDYIAGEKAGRLFAIKNFSEGSRMKKEPGALRLAAKSAANGANEDFISGFEKGYSKTWSELAK